MIMKNTFLGESGLSLEEFKVPFEMLMVESAKLMQPVAADFLGLLFTDDDSAETGRDFMFSSHLINY